MYCFYLDFHFASFLLFKSFFFQFSLLWVFYYGVGFVGKSWMELWSDALINDFHSAFGSMSDLLLLKYSVSSIPCTEIQFSIFVPTKTSISIDAFSAPLLVYCCFSLFAKWKKQKILFSFLCIVFKRHFPLIRLEMNLFFMSFYHFGELGSTFFHYSVCLFHLCIF